MSIERLPDELLLAVLTFVEIQDLGKVSQVSTRLKRIVGDAQLWRLMGTRCYGDYLSTEDLKENPREKVVSHYLKVIVNTTEDLEKMERLINYYPLSTYTRNGGSCLSSKYCSSFLANSTEFSKFAELPDYEELALQGN